jgi:hypothetical protein
MMVDRARRHDLAIGSDLRLDDSLDALSSHVGLRGQGLRGQDTN